MDETTEMQRSSPTAIIVGRASDNRQDFADLRAQFVKWLATPAEFRKPGLQRQWAVKHSLHETTLSQWKAEPEVQAGVIKLVRENAYNDLPEIVSALKAAAKGGNVLAMKLFFQWATGWSEKIEHTGTVESRVVHVGFGDESAQPWFSNHEAAREKVN